MIKETRNPQDTACWLQDRWGYVTGTGLGKALGSPKVQETYMYEVVAERMTSTAPAFDGNANMRRGTEMEPFARAAVIEETGLPIEEANMLYSPYLKGFRFSPDGVIRDNGMIIAGVEIKCPTSAVHIKYMHKGGVPQEYYWQVMSPFVLSNQIEYWLFASYDDRNYERPLYIHPVYRDDIKKEITVARKGLRSFIERVEKLHMEIAF